MKNDTWTYFQAVVESGSIQAAARNIVIVPSALSRQIKLLEREVGVQLFERSATGMTPTPAGRVFHDLVRRQQAELSDVLRQLRLGVAETQTELRIACVEGMLPYLLPRWLPILRKRHPQVVFVVNSMSSTAVTDAVSSGEAELGFAFGRVARAGLRVLATSDTPIQLAIPSDHRLAGREHVSIADVVDDHLILPNTRFGIRREFDRESARQGLQFQVIYETDSLSFALTMVRRENLVTLTTAGMLAQQDDEGIIAKTLVEPGFNSTSIALVSQSGPSSSIVAVIQHELALMMENAGR